MGTNFNDSRQKFHGDQNLKNKSYFFTFQTNQMVYRPLASNRLYIVEIFQNENSTGGFKTVP